MGARDCFVFVLGSVVLHAPRTEHLTWRGHLTCGPGVYLFSFHGGIRAVACFFYVMRPLFWVIGGFGTEANGVRLLVCQLLHTEPPFKLEVVIKF